MSDGRRGSWPRSLLLARHGESAGNVARDLAEAEGLEVIDIQERDTDVDLSELGERQAKALGTWLGDLGDERPTVALASPYRRAVRTAELAIEAGGLDLELVVDERLREREFGILDRLTHAGIAARHPEEAEARARLGKFYHRPPGGESWCDVGLRVRSALDSATREHEGERLFVVAHQVVIFMFRYVLEHLDEHQVLAASRAEELTNCSLTTYVHDPSLGRNGGMRLRRFNEAVALEEADTTVTAEPDPAPGGTA
ncbi:MAG TPA: histidine phosphatase family protein [Aquihabitans sp.]|nr:histidine phosphatase family protein [Aquihabitans sp.]